MATETRTELIAFQEFVARLARDPQTKDWTAEDALILWRQIQDEMEDSVAAIREGIADMEAGRGRPVDEVFDDLHAKIDAMRER